MSTALAGSRILDVSKQEGKGVAGVGVLGVSNQRAGVGVLGVRERKVDLETWKGEGEEREGAKRWRVGDLFQISSVRCKAPDFELFF